MNAKDFIRLGIPLGEGTRRATDFISKLGRKAHYGQNAGKDADSDSL